MADQINLYSQVLESQYKQIGSAKDSEVGSYKSNLSAYTAYIDWTYNLIQVMLILHLIKADQNHKEN
ncbi:hypothetical protein F6J65_03010 [Mycoplasmoides gallisepticum]|nr:hypothetical protein F6J65_03010 [Mycoplasmoides gallisepticum]